MAAYVFRTSATKQAPSQTMELFLGDEGNNLRISWRSVQVGITSLGFK